MVRQAKASRTQEGHNAQPRSAAPKRETRTARRPRTQRGTLPAGRGANEARAAYFRDGLLVSLLLVSLLLVSLLLVSLLLVSLLLVSLLLVSLLLVSLAPPAPLTAERAGR
jgi:hypothetical protein